MSKLIIFNRQCSLSTVSINKSRPPWFSRKRCFETLHDPLVDRFIITFDDARGSIKNHFLYDCINNEELVKFNSGTESGAFLFTLNFLMLQLSDNLIKPDDNILIVEDDYMFKPGWAKILIEGIDMVGESGFVAPYDHRDKYDRNVYNGLTSQIFISDSCHWRTTPSTTNTYAGKARAFEKFYELHKVFSTGVSITRDHDKFIETWANGGKLISPMPSIASHIDPPHMAPCYNWNF